MPLSAVSGTEGLLQSSIREGRIVSLLYVVGKGSLYNSVNLRNVGCLVVQRSLDI